MEKLKIENTDSIEDVIQRSIAHIVKEHNNIEVSVTYSDFRNLYEDYHKATGEQLMSGKPYSVGPVSITFKKRRNGNI